MPGTLLLIQTCSRPLPEDLFSGLGDLAAPAQQDAASTAGQAANPLEAPLAYVSPVPAQPQVPSLMAEELAPAMHNGLVC